MRENVPLIIRCPAERKRAREVQNCRIDPKTHHLIQITISGAVHWWFDSFVRVCVCEMKTMIIIFDSICMSYLLTFFLSFFTHRNIWHFFLSSKSHKFHRVCVDSRVNEFSSVWTEDEENARGMFAYGLLFCPCPSFFNPTVKPLRMCFRFLRCRRRRRFGFLSLQSFCIHMDYYFLNASCHIALEQ